MHSNAADLSKRLAWQPALSMAITYPQAFEPEQALPRVATQGFRAIELYFLYGPDHCDWQDEGLIRRTFAVAQDVGLAVWSLHAPDEGFFADELPALRQYRVDVLKRLIDIAAEMRVAVITTHAGINFEAGPQRPKGIDLLHKGLEQIGQHIANTGVKLGLETTMHRPHDIPNSDLIQAVRRHDEKWLGIVLDTGHAHVAGVLRGLAEKIGSRLCSVHLHDNMGDVDYHLFPRQGNIDWPLVIREIVAGGYDGPLMLEVGPREGPLKQRLADSWQAAEFLLELYREAKKQKVAARS